MKTRTDPGLKKAIAVAGGVKALAEALTIPTSTVSCWDQVPLKHVKRIEAAFPGEISRYEMRPDDFGEKPNA